MDENVTAEWARNECNKETDKVIKLQIVICEEAIKKAVKSTKQHCDMYINMIKGTADMLRKRGFEVETLGGERNEAEFYRISW